MNSMMEPEDSNSIQAIIEKLTGQVSDPSELDEATKSLGMPAFLLNFYFATLEDLSPMGLGKAVYIPVQITEREGGRKSLFYLDPGEEVLAGIYAMDQGVALRYVRRDTGNGSPAQTGDIYSVRITNREGKEEFFQGQGNFEMIDPSRGEGKFTFTGTSKATGSEVITRADCYLWSWGGGSPKV